MSKKGQEQRTGVLTVAEVATLMRLPKMAVYGLIHAGELDAERVGRRFHISQRAVDAYLDAAH